MAIIHVTPDYLQETPSAVQQALAELLQEACYEHPEGFVYQVGFEAPNGFAYMVFAARPLEGGYR